METSAFKYIGTATTTQVKTGAGKLRRIVITETVASVITVYDDVAGTSNIIAAFKASVVEGTYEFSVPFTNGLKVVTAGAGKLTVVYE